MDLTRVKDHKLEVILIPPDIAAGELVYRLPAIVPGTYAVYDFGRFVSGFTVTDKDGSPVPTERLDINSWKIPRAGTIGKISYWVEDTWNTSITGNIVFEPGGTNIEKDKNYLINTHGFFGYFERYKTSPFELEFKKPSGFYGSTALVAESNTANLETYAVSDYMRLVDSPIMFCVPDTTTLNIGGAKILISVYSAKKDLQAKIIAGNIAVILNAQKDYLGGKLPIDKYAFIIYMLSGTTRSGSYGALEHSYSSFYVLPEMEPAELGRQVRDFAAHEFFHIITPLSIHSEEIGNFDFNAPKMSEHLWMYEGVTEYFAGHVQVKQGLEKPEDYLEVIHKKIDGKDAYNDTLPFTRMSSGVLVKYKDQYDNVYQKGALIGLCLDIELRRLSGGKYGLMDLMKDLAKVYGRTKSFKDDELFGEITKLTFPEIGIFLDKYVGGSHPLPLREELNLMGIDYQELSIRHGISPLGGINPAFDMETKRFNIQRESLRDMDDFGKSIGFKVGDEILKFNGKRLRLGNAEKLLGDYFIHVKEGTVLRFLVLRKNEETGKTAKVKLSVKVVPADVLNRNVLSLNKNPDAQQLELRKAWIGP
jgi:predicted metalloprotease with PDZ domain